MELDLQKDVFAHGGAGEGRVVQAEELGQVMDGVWHFWNLRGSVLLRGSSVKRDPEVCRGALYETLRMPYWGGFVIPWKALPPHCHPWFICRL